MFSGLMQQRGNKAPLFFIINSLSIPKSAKNKTTKIPEKLNILAKFIPLQCTNK